ncbi:MAG: radical SAM protein [Candidatus Cloacimonetes bacterium]|nr:radical SAM protein [Candidatus Cloacimonadota bacterium]
MNRIREVLIEGVNILKFNWGSLKPIKGPVRVTLTLTNRCNARCIMCDRWKNKTKELPTEKWKDIISQLKISGVRALTFLGGEAFLRDDLFELIQYAKEENLSTTLITNGLLLTYHVDDIISSEVDSVIVSLDSTNEKQHDKIRKCPGNFRKLMEGLKMLLSKRDKKPYIYFSFTINNKNVKEVERVLKLAKDINVDGVNFGMVHDYSNNLPIEIANVDLKKLQEQINKMKEYKELLTYPVEFYQKFKLFNKNSKELHKKLRCSSGYFFTRITPDGKILLCNSNSLQPIGDLKKDAFKSIWNSKSSISMREKIKNCSNSTCWLRCNGPIDIFVSSMRNPIALFKFIKNNSHFIKFVIKRNIG